MQISEAIAILQKIQMEHGDLKLLGSDPYTEVCFNINELRFIANKEDVPDDTAQRYQGKLPIVLVTQDIYKKG